MEKKPQQKARRGKPFKVGTQNIRKPNLKKCTIALDRKDVEEKVKEKTEIEEPIKKQGSKKRKWFQRRKLL